MATAEQALSWVNKLYTVLQGRRPDVEKAFDYFGGKQPLAYASEQWKKFHEDRYRNFSDNWCGVVGRSPVERLGIYGIRVGDDVDVVSDDERELWLDWQRNEMEAQASQGFLASTIAKRSAVLVWGDENDEPDVSWEHPSQVAVAYAASNRRRRTAALKAWTEDGLEFATLYLPDEVWKFERPSYMSGDESQTASGIVLPGFVGNGGWRPREVVGENWPLRNPLGEVPVVEWLNRPMLGQEPMSDIAGTMAMQDAINMLWAYLFTAADHASMPARVVTGAEPPKVPILDENGQVVGSKPAKLEDLAQGRLLFLPGSQGNKPSIDQWDAAKLDVFTGVIAEAIGHIASQTSTPGHYLLTNEKFANLNGDALTAAETPLVQKVKEAHKYYSGAARDTFRLMAKVRGNDGLAEEVRTARIEWKDAEMHSLSQIADAATKDRAVGISLATVLRTRYGMNQQQVDEELRRVREESADTMLANLLRPTPDEVGDADPGA